MNREVGWSTESNLLWAVLQEIKRLKGIIYNSTGGGGGGVQSVTGTTVNNTDPLNPIVEVPSLAQVLAIDNKTNDIPIVSNNGKAAVDVNDAYTSLSYETQVFAMGDTGVQLYSEVPVTFDSNVSTNFNTPVLKYNTEEVATQNWVTSQGYDMITGLTFSGVFSLDKKGGRSYLPYTQTGSLTLSIAGSPIVGGFAVLRFTANGSAISGYSSWKLLSSDGITATNGVVHRVIVYQYEDEIWYSVKLN